MGNAAYVFMTRARDSDDIAGKETDLGAGVRFDTCEIA
jgi:hypothetical protein